MIKRNDLDLIKHDIDVLRKEGTLFMTKDEFWKRLHVVNSEISNKMNERPTFSYLNNKLKILDMVLFK